MTLPADKLQEIEDLAYRYLDKKEIALVADIDADLLSEDDHPAYKAFMTGRLKRKAQFNWNVMKLSDQLSSPAQNIELKMAEATCLNDKKR